MHPKSAIATCAQISGVTRRWASGGSARRCRTSTTTETHTSVKMTLRIQKPVPASEYHA